MPAFPRQVVSACAAALLLLSTASAARALTAEHRLERTVRPTSETLTLDVDPTRDGYTGTARIGLNVTAPVTSFQLHARRLTLDHVALRAGTVAVPVTFAVDSNDVVTVQTAKTLAAGPATLTLAFHNDFDRQANGLYKLQSGEDWYVYSDFEPNDARQAWPCFDEPEFKMPWQMIVTAPKGAMVVSNTPIARDLPAAGRHTVTFQRTPPLPSYLIALAVGPFDAVPIRGMSVPGRVIAPRGQGPLAATAAKLTPALLAGLERYFGRPYPYAKLDLIAVPEFWAGAMENAGAVTYRADRLLLDPAVATPDAWRSLISTTAHELAHMWFGDLVTLAWWDDTWLNESFASWLGNKISQQAYPVYRYDVRQAEEVERALGLDTSPFGRAVRQRVDAFEGFNNLFDPLAYQKGQAVLEMVEQWLGPATFRRGVQSYIAAHAWGNAAGADLWSALSKAAGRDVAGVVRSFIEQPGVPFVTVEPRADGSVVLTQRRLVNDPARTMAPETWQIPVALRWSDREGVHHRTELLTDSTQVVSLAPAGTLRWVLPHAEAVGYYRWNGPETMLGMLADSSARMLTPRERIAFVHNLAALLASDHLHGDAFLALDARFASDPDPLVLQAALAALEPVQRSILEVPTRVSYAAWARRTYAPALDQLGMVPAPNEDPSTTLLRGSLVRFLGEWGRDPNVIERARTLADAWLEDSTAVPPSLVGPALQVTALHGDAARLATYRQHFEQARVPSVRTQLLEAMGAFRDPALVQQVLDYTVQGPLRPQERNGLFRSLGQDPALGDLVYQWLTTHYDAVGKFLPGPQRRTLISVAGGCSPTRLEAGRAFFGAPERRFPTFERDWSRLDAAVHDCVELHDREAGRVRNFLENAAANP